jgi:MoaA/NifB/PqqE/SkfB family radical SAM enzyme
MANKIRFPRNFSIQTTSSCNARCVFCPNKDVRELFPPAVMSDSLFEKIIAECSGHREIERLILYMSNEPLTDPKICERIDLAKERVPWACVHILTNGSLLTPETARRLAASKAGWVGISMHGIRKETVESAMGLDFEQTMRRVLDFIAAAKERSTRRRFNRTPRRPASRHRRE